MPDYDDATTVAVSNAMWHALDGDYAAVDAELGGLSPATLRDLRAGARMLARRVQITEELRAEAGR